MALEAENQAACRLCYRHLGQTYTYKQAQVNASFVLYAANVYTGEVNAVDKLRENFAHNQVESST